MSDNRMKSCRRRRRNVKSFKERNFNLCNIRYFGFSAVRCNREEGRGRGRGEVKGAGLIN